MTRRRTVLAGVASFAALAIAGALFFTFKPHPRAKTVDIELFPQSELVKTSAGQYVCPVRLLVVGMPPLPPPEVDPECHRQTKAEADEDAERKRLLVSPEFLALRSLAGTACNQKFLTNDQVHQFLANHPDVRRWVDRHPHAALDLGLPMQPGIAMGCPTP